MYIQIIIKDIFSQLTTERFKGSDNDTAKIYWPHILSNILYAFYMYCHSTTSESGYYCYL